MRFEVPQFIEVEDKIFGPFTWRQFVYLAGGGGIAAVIFFASNNLLVFILLGLPIALLAGALAFYPVNNRPFSYFLEAMFNYATGKRLYLWRKKESIVYRGKRAKTEQDVTDGQVRPSIGKDISSMARRLELQALQKNSR